MQPISQKMEAQFEGPSNSKAINTWVSDSYTDLLKLYDLANQHDLIIPQNFKMLTLENIYLQKAIASLSATLATLQANIGTSNKTLYHSFMDDTNMDLVPNYSSLENNTECGTLSVPKSQEISKLYLVDMNGKNNIPQSLACTIYESTSPIDISRQYLTGNMIPYDLNMANIFDGDINSFYLRQSTQSTSIDNIYFCLDIKLPTNIINHTRANTISIDACPSNSFSILDIQYQSLSDWNHINNFFPSEIPTVGKFNIFFPTRDVVGLRIYCKQNDWILANGARNFYYGFRGVDVNYSTFKTEECRSRVTFNIPDSSKQFTKIISVTPGFKLSSVGDARNFSVKQIIVGAQQFQLGDVLPVLTKSVDIEIELALVGDVSPLLDNISIVYASA